jgi:type II secretory pathway pseudopilin PulG
VSQFPFISDEDLDLFELGVLSADEAARIREQLAVSPELQERLAARSADNSLLAFALHPDTVATSPSADARDNFLRAMRHEQPAQPVVRTAVSEPTPRRSFLPVWVLGFVTAMLLIACGILVIQNVSYRQENQNQSAALQQQQQQVQLMQSQVAAAKQASLVLSTLQAPDTTRFVLTSAAAPPQPQIKTFFRKSTGQVVLIASKLPALPAGKTYELWLIATDGTAPIPAGTFTPDAQGNVTATLTQTAANKDPKVFAVTIEQAAGASSPTMPIVFAGSQGL